jgi:ABC-type amino acid transport substrate-binding protein
MNVRIGILAATSALALLAAACSDGRVAPASTATPTTTDAMGSSVKSSNLAPEVRGFYKGGEVLFIHTEASDPQVASMLTMMMGPQVVVAPSLAQAPESALASVYVFTNGVKGGGPFGFQPDVFDSVPGDQAYSPLRAVILVTWKDGVTARELRSIDEIRPAESKGELTTKRPGAVVNMPMLSWPGGHR